MLVEACELVDVTVDANTILGRVALVAPGVAAWCEPAAGPVTADLIDFGIGLRGVVVTITDLTDLTDAAIGDGLVALRARFGPCVWIRLLTCP